jgi:2-methylcitrate dehydratase PrpD
MLKKMAAERTPILDSVIRFVTEASIRDYPAEVIEATRKCLVDWVGVALGAASEAPGTIVRQALPDNGLSLVLSGGTASAATAALINGTLAHSLDFDDTHVASLSHISGPTWATVLALAPSANAADAHLLGAFITGFEVGARLGSIVGPALLERGVHATGVIGGLAATAAGCALLSLDRAQTANAFGLAATQAGGLTASFGTMAKPFHAGRAGMNGVIAVQLARAGFTASHEIFDSPKGLAGVLIQDRSIVFKAINSNAWQILHNTFKPYASCLLTHPSIDCARQLSGACKAGTVERVVAHVHPLAIELAGKREPQTSLEGKFSLPFCIALALGGYKASATDFSEPRLNDISLRKIADRVELKSDAHLRATAARLSMAMLHGSRQAAEITFALGNPENPMQWQDIADKFLALTEPQLGLRAKTLFAHLRCVETVADIAAIAPLLTAVRDSEMAVTSN